jgi:hypothetical protein
MSVVHEGADPVGVVFRRCVSPLQIGSAILVIFLLIIQFIAMIWCVSASTLGFTRQLDACHSML